MTDQQFEQLESKVDSLTVALENLRRFTINAHSHSVNSFKISEGKIDILNIKLESLAKDSNKNFDDVKGKLEEIQNEIGKIDEVSRYSEEYENLLKVVGGAK